MRTLTLAAFALALCPVTPTPEIDPCEEQAQLAPALLDVGDRFGESVAAEGSRMAVGAPFHDEQKGAVFVFSFDGASRNLVSTNTPNQGELGGQVGHAGGLGRGLPGGSAPEGDTAGPDAGAVYVFEET